jgi:hypothetical protein
MTVSGYHYAAGSRDVRTAVGHAGSTAQMPSHGFGWWSGLSGSPSPPSARGKAQYASWPRWASRQGPTPQIAPWPRFPMSVNALIAPPSLGSSTRGDRRSALESWKGKAAARYRDEATTVRHVLVRLRDDTDPTSRNTASRPSGSRDEHDDAGTEGGAGRHVGRRAARP